MALDARTEQLIQDGLHDLLLMRLVREVKVAQPAAGANWSQVVPGGIIWELLAIDATLTTSAVVGNRNPTVRLVDADAIPIMRFPTGATVPASNARELSQMAGLGVTDGTAASQSSLPDPPAVLLPGWQLVSLTSNLDVGDQYSAVVLSVRVWSESQVVQNAQQIGLALQSLTIDK